MLIAFNKPYGVLCQFTDRSTPPRPTLAGFGLPPDVYPAGRLDFDSEGLLLLTDDGALAHKFTDPRQSSPRPTGCRSKAIRAKTHCRHCGTA